MAWVFSETEPRTTPRLGDQNASPDAVLLLHLQVCFQFVAQISVAAKVAQPRKPVQRATFSLFLHPCLVSGDEVEHANRAQRVFPIQDEKRSALRFQVQVLPEKIPGAMSTG